MERKKSSFAFEVCKGEIQTHCFCRAVNKKNFGVGHKLRRCSTVLLPFKKIKFCDSRLASCVLDLYLLIKFGI